ncbi:MAG: OmpA family protein [Bacteroidota bacterium]|nr:OmpA family protein [Bacteroidota bacterium]MDX5428304.1 OmpA family protein [Bacteroidota bacterium]MDX5506086.1 OmpA family protein [Bacteroidota bacterium]
MKNRLLLSAFILLFAQGACAQSKRSLQWFESARLELRDDNYHEARVYLDKAIERDPDFINALELRGDLNSAEERYEEAENDYNQALNQGGKSHLYYKLGVVQMKNLHYTQARESFAQYLRSDRKTPGIERLIQDKLMKNIDFAEGALQDQVAFDPKNLGEAVNQQDMQYFPSISGDGKTLVYTSRNYEGPYSNEDFFITTRNDSGEWSEAERMKGFLNSPGNEGAQSLSADGKLIIFAACERRDSRGSCDLYYSFDTGEGVWSEPRNIGDSINSRAWESQPSLSADGRTLYFVRGIDARTQNIDIYYSELHPDGYWKKAQRLPGKVNTPFKEESPFIHFDGRSLYFGSDGHPGMGGSDLFVSRKQEDGTWGEPENLGYPINTPKSEFSLIVDPDGRTGYFASDRDGEKGYMDLFMFELPLSVRATPVAWVKGVITDRKTGKPLKAELQFLDLANGDLFTKTESDVNGVYFAVLPVDADYALNISKPGYLFHSENFSLIQQPENRAFPLDVKLSPIQKDVKVKLNNVFFATDSYELRPESKVELNKVVEFLDLNPNVIVEVQGHTDNEGSSAYNLQLSKKRAASVVDYLKSQGIASARMKSAGFGDTQPVATNETEEGRQANRRTEMKIIEIL